NGWLYIAGYQLISIHAPAKGATFPFFHSNMWDYISIHAPAKGATCNIAFGKLHLIKFQSTHPQRVRQCAIAPFITKTKNLLNKLVQ
ncbi:TPA: hypothetical protein ACGN0V_002191, partial [Streptococcus agalactiae]